MALLLCKMNVLDIFNMVDFIFLCLLYREVLKFWSNKTLHACTSRNLYFSKLLAQSQNNRSSKSSPKLTDVLNRNTYGLSLFYFVFNIGEIAYSRTVIFIFQFSNLQLSKFKNKQLGKNIAELPPELFIFSSFQNFWEFLDDPFFWNPAKTVKTN